MSFDRLSDYVDELRHRISQINVTGDLRVNAAQLVLATYGFAAPIEMINVAALALSMDRLAVHELSGGAIRLVHDADLRSVPDEPPRLLRKAWLVESKDLDEPLFGNTVCLGGYQLDGAYYLVGLQYPDGAMVARWVPEWGGEDIEIPVDHSPLIDNVEGHHEFALDAARFSIILGLLLEAQRSPIVVKDVGSSGGRQRTRQSGGRRRGAGEWAVRRVMLGRLELRHSYTTGTTRHRGSLADDRVPQQTMVRGHLRRVRYGPGRGDTRWTWVESYEARRWVAPKVRYRIDG